MNQYDTVKSLVASPILLTAAWLFQVCSTVSLLGHTGIPRLAERHSRDRKINRSSAVNEGPPQMSQQVAVTRQKKSMHRSSPETKDWWDHRKSVGSGTQTTEGGNGCLVTTNTFSLHNYYSFSLLSEPRVLCYHFMRQNRSNSTDINVRSCNDVPVRRPKLSRYRVSRHKGLPSNTERCGINTRMTLTSNTGSVSHVILITRQNQQNFINSTHDCLCSMFQVGIQIKFRSSVDIFSIF